MVRCSDNSSYHGDILVGADGAYSAVRQNLYKSLKEDHKLPSSDDVSLPFGCVCLVGQTIPLDPEEFPHLKEELSQFNTVLGVSTMCTVSLNIRICPYDNDVQFALN
jgi:2-polyprenyl-6-methoxyphenol hydroxylase-like FAD-dependent oxidoreductase